MTITENILVGLARLPWLGRFVERWLLRCHRLSVGVMKRVQRDYVRPRNWSNHELKKIGADFSGDIINVSGWRDEDKTGSHYATYFPNARSYAVSNFKGESGLSGQSGEIFIDLEDDLPAGLVGKYQVAFNHTTLEHVFDIKKAIANICALSHDTVILVTPFLQQVHFIDGSFGDWWRPTPACMARLLEEQGFSVRYQSTNDNPWYIVYVFTVASRRTEKSIGSPSSAYVDKVGEVHFGMGGHE
ncbi:MAG TPA: hypothetical protein PKY22_00070 [Accumulibacter sp.]|nr:hypothetical protein [Accumulibacter sp.]